GLWARTLRSRSSASPACATTSQPPSSRSRTSPSRSSTESSATSTRSDPASAIEQRAQALAREVGLRHEAARAACLDARLELAPVPARDQDHGRCPAGGDHPIGDLEAVDVGQVYVEQHEVG